MSKQMTVDPRWLDGIIVDGERHRLSVTDIMVYSFMEYSSSTDEEGRVFYPWGTQMLMDKLNFSEYYSKKSFRNLKRLGLITRKHVGLGHKDIIFLHRPTF